MNKTHMNEFIGKNSIPLDLKIETLNSRATIHSVKLKVAVLGTRGFPNVQGGVETHCEQLYKQLVTMGCEVLVFTRKPYVGQGVNIYKGIKLIPLPCPRSKFLETFFHTFIGIFAAKIYSPDILHIHAIGPSLFIPLARLLGLKVIMTNHGPDYERKKWGRLAKIVLRLGENIGSKWSHGIISISETIAKNITNKYKKNVSVLPNGVIIPEIVQSDTALKMYGITKGNYILSVGRFVPEKGFHDLIDAFCKYQNQDSGRLSGRWKLVIVGKADHEDWYSTNLKEKAQCNDNIVLTGFLSGVPLYELYSHAGLFVLPSYYEGLPIVLLEAMSYGLSCIASDIPANRNVGLPDKRFFTAGNIKELALKMQEFTDKPLDRDGKIRQTELIAKRYDWHKIAIKTMKVYKSVVNDNP